MSTTRTKDRKGTSPNQKAIEVPEAEETVTCFISGAVVPKSAASLVKLGPGQRVWMAHTLISDREREKRS